MVNKSEAVDGGKARASVVEQDEGWRCRRGESGGDVDGGGEDDNDGDVDGEDDGDGDNDGDGEDDVEGEDHSTRRPERRLRQSRLASRRSSDESTHREREENGATVA